MSIPKTPKIEHIELSTLVQDIKLSGRTEKEIAENAKEKWQQIEAHGGEWDAAQPGLYFVRKGEKHLAAGFSRVRACLDHGITHGYFTRIEDDASKLRTISIRSNGGKQTSAYKQGELYAAMRDGTNPESAEAGETIFEPMKTDAIAKEVGKSRQWVETCISVYENDPEVGELIQSGQVAPGAVAKVKQWLGKDREEKLLKFLKAGIRSAQSEKSGQMATQKHMEPHRAEFAPLKAATPEKAKQSATTPVAELQPEESRSAEVPDAPGKVKDGKYDGGIPEEFPSGICAPSELDLGSSDSTPAPERRKNKLREEYTAIVNNWITEQEVQNTNDEDVAILVEKLTNQALPF